MIDLAPNVPEDALRLWVMAFAVPIIFLYLRAAWTMFQTTRREKVLDDLDRGRAARSAAVVLLIGEEVVAVYERLGNADLNPRTPILQIALIFALYSWSKLDRREYISPDEGIDNIVEKMRDADS